MTADAGRLRLGACLSLSGKYARFGRQARLGLEILCSWDEALDLVIEDDQSRPEVLEAGLRRLSARCDVLLGPYSTQLMRRAGKTAVELDRLIWNHGGSGDDVEAAHPGHVVSVLTPASRYADPFIRCLNGTAGSAHLWIAQGRGGFGRQVADGAEATARSLGLRATRLGPGEALPSAGAEEWALICAGSFEEDIETVERARALPTAPRTICAVAAGVREFGEAVGDPRGIYGVGQWFPGSPGSGDAARIGPAESDFLTAYRERSGSLPDYPAVQAAAAAVIATHCTRVAGGTARDVLWPTATELETTTLFGSFKIDSRTGAQVGHRAALVRWETGGPVAV